MTTATLAEVADQEWGLPALDLDTVASIVAVVKAESPVNAVASMASTCSSLWSSFEPFLRASRDQEVEALMQRLGWTWNYLAEAQILHSTGMGITDAELRLIVFLLFDAGTSFAPRLDHLNMGSNRISDRGVAALINGAARAPQKQLEVLMLSSNMIGDRGAIALARAIKARVTFPRLNMLTVGGNVQMSAAGETALREACEFTGVSVRGVGMLRGAPIVKEPMKGSWIVKVEVDAEGATRTRSGVRERAVARGDPFICP